MRIAVDAMGGDYGPATVVEGAVMAARELGVELILVGDRERVETELARKSARGLPLRLYHASEAVEMEESPAVALRRKRDSSIRVCFDLIKKGEAYAMVSAGNSGAVMAGAIMTLRNIAGIERPALALLLPTIKGGATVFLDVGGNVDCKPFHLAQFAVMGSVYAEFVLDKENPKVALLSNGQEEMKGNDATREAHALLKGSQLNYLGYVEGRDLFKGDVDVIVCDGFVGNIVLKACEGMVDAMRAIFRQEVRAHLLSRLGYPLLKEAVREFERKFDYDQYGGAPLLGVNGVAIISHGSSSAKAIRNAIRVASELVDRKVNEHLVESLARNPQLTLLKELKI